jgi:endonuclease/exonuclease/phosphatase family metal-dependent hydrolase
VLAVWCVLALLPLVTACGLGRGYAPPAHTVHTGQAAAFWESDPDSIRIMSWNIQYGRDLERALADIRSHPDLWRADLVMLQEMDTFGASLLADSLGFNHVYSPAAVHPHHQETFGNAVLSRWPVLATSVLVLPHPTPLTGHRRIAVAASLDLGAGRRLTAVSVHTATVISQTDARMDQAAALMDSLMAGDDPVLVAGDFNTVTTHDVKLLRRLARKRGLKQLRLPPGPTISNRIKRFPGSVPVLDHIFYRGLAPGRRGVVRSARASDHYPLWAVFAAPVADPERE